MMYMLIALNIATTKYATWLWLVGYLIR